MTHVPYPGVIVSAEVEEHIWTKHQVTPEEAEEACFSRALAKRGRDRSYSIFGRTEAGRYLLVVLYPRGKGIFSLATARDMSQTERRYYQQRQRK